MDIIISRMTMLDVPEVMELEKECFTSAWSEAAFIEELGREYSYVLVARAEDRSLAGFVCFWRVVDEMHILNVAVREDLRRKGIARKLVEAAIAYAGERGALSATLEVRESNTAAIGLYTSLGFVNAGIRKSYYENPRENAVIMWIYDLSRTGRKSP
jgi:ribosomal-protein-alanine N-acetyltransferase